MELIATLLWAFGLLAVLGFVAFSAGFAMRLAAEEWFMPPSTPWLQVGTSVVTFLVLITLILGRPAEQPVQAVAAPPAPAATPAVEAPPSTPEPTAEPAPAVPLTAPEPEPEPPGPEQWHITGNLVNVRSGPGLTFTVVGQASRYDTVDATGPLNRGWLPVANNLVRGFISFEYLAFGSGEDAYLRRCRASLGPRPANGTILSQSTPGPHRVTFRNTLDTDLIVKLSNIFGVTGIKVYLRAGGDAQINTVADGVFRVSAARGQEFSQGCGVFVDNFDAQRSEREWAFERARSGAIRQSASSFTINAASLFSGVDRTRPVSVTEFALR